MIIEEVPIEEEDEDEFFIGSSLNIKKRKTEKKNPLRRKCPHCDYETINSNNLKRHIQIHTGHSLKFSTFKIKRSTSTRVFNL